LYISPVRQAPSAIIQIKFLEAHDVCVTNLILSQLWSTAVNKGPCVVIRARSINISDELSGSSNYRASAVCCQPGWALLLARRYDLEIFPKYLICIYRFILCSLIRVVVPRIGALSVAKQVQNRRVSLSDCWFMFFIFVLLAT